MARRPNRPVRETLMMRLQRLFFMEYPIVGAMAVLAALAVAFDAQPTKADANPDTAGVASALAPAVSTPTLAGDPNAIRSDDRSDDRPDDRFDELGDTTAVDVFWSHQGTVAPGDTLSVSARGFPALTTVEIGIGPPASEYGVVGQAQASMTGEVAASVSIPTDLPADISVVVVVATEDFRVRGQSAEIGLSESRSPAYSPVIAPRQGEGQDLLSFLQGEMAIPR